MFLVTRHDGERPLFGGYIPGADVVFWLKPAIQTIVEPT